MRRRDRGVVLLFVMGAVVVLTVIAVELASRASVDVLLASRTIRESAFRRLADSGVGVGRAQLTEPEAKTFDYWGEAWAEGIRCDLSPQEAITVKVVDESGKINIRCGPNGVPDGPRVARMLGRLFEYLRRAEPGRSGELRDAERKLLHRLGLSPKGKAEPPERIVPLTTLDGLREAGLEASQVFGRDGLSDYLTCFGDGLINLNTALAPVLYALDDEIDQALVDRIAVHRGKPGDYRPFKEPKELERVEGIVVRTSFEGGVRVARNLFSKIQGRISTRSGAFSIRVECRIGDRVRDVWTFVEPGRESREGGAPHRSLRQLAYEEIMP